MATYDGNAPAPVSLGNNGNGTYRGIGSSWFNARKIALEDYYRNAQMADYQNAFSAEQAELDRVFQSTEAEKNRSWQEYMDSTAVQRKVADMKTAGINPILAYSMAGSQAPSGGVASGSTARATSMGYRANAGSTDPLNALASALVAIGAGLLTKNVGIAKKFAVGFGK